MAKAMSTVGLLVAAVGFAAFVGLGVGVWYARERADRAAAEAATKADAAGDIAARVVGLVRDAAAQTEADLAAARAAAAAAPPDRPSPVARLAARQLSVNLDHTRDVVAAASEAVLAANSLLEVFGSATDKKERLGVGAGEVGQVRAGLDAAAQNLRQVQGVVGGATPEQLSAVGAAVARVRVVADDLDARLADLRGRIVPVRDRAMFWAFWGAVGVTALSAVGALGQVFLARACWRGLVAG